MGVPSLDQLVHRRLIAAAPTSSEGRDQTMTHLYL